MEEEMIHVDENEKVEDKEGIGARAMKGVKSFFGFFVKNPFLIVPLCSMVFTGFMNLATGGGQHDKCLVEDDVTKEDFMVKHPLTNSEILELSARMDDGQRKGDALNEMGLLKREKKRK